MILSIFKDPTVRRFINSYYEKKREKCTSLEELRYLVAKKILPLMLYTMFNEVFVNISQYQNEDGTKMKISQIKQKLKDAQFIKDFESNLRKIIKEVGIKQDDLNFLKQNNELLNQQIDLLKDFGLDLFLDDVEPLKFLEEPEVRLELSREIVSLSEISEPEEEELKEIQSNIEKK